MTLGTEKSTDHRPQRRQPVLGFLVDCIDDSYQNELFSALVDAASMLGASLLCFAGGTPAEAGGAESPSTAVYDLVGPENVDAIILSAGTLESGLGAERVEQFIERFGELPTVSIGIALDGVASVVLDNFEGMRELVAHLIVVHARKRVAFVRGPSTNEEAEARYRGYRAALEAARLEFDPKLVVEGTFLGESGRRAVEVLEQRRVRYDALVAANDDMALAAMRELALRGVGVPERIAVAGFDDDVPARYAQPALTTVRQPLRTIALHAVKSALGALAGKEPPGCIRVETEFVRRRSCGCPLNEEEIAVESPSRPRRGDEESPLVRKRDELAAAMVAAARGCLDHEYAERLIDVFMMQLRGRQKESFATVWDELLGRLATRGADVRRLQPAISALRRGAIPALVDLQGMLIRAETMLHEARVLLANEIHYQEAQRRLAQARATHVLSDVAQSLIVSSDLPTLVRSIAKSLPDLEIPSGFIALCEQGTCVPGERSSSLRLLMAHRQSEPHASRLQDEIFEAKWLLPGDLLRLDVTRAYVVQPLYFGANALGIAVFELGPRDGNVYEALRAQISAAVEAATLSQERETLRPPKGTET